MTFDFYVDSVAGDDGNAGTSPEAAYATLAAADAVAVNGSRIGLAKGSTWREGLDLSTLTGVTVQAYGAGDAPVITGFDIQTSWVDDTGTVSGRWYKDVTSDGYGTWRQVVLQDNALMVRVASAAACTATGQYFSADTGSNPTTRVYINVGAENPNSNGKVYEATTRSTALHLGSGATVRGIVCRGAISNNGPLETGADSIVERCLAAFGTKHNALIASGTVTDCVFYDSDLATATEPAVNPLVAYAINQTGKSFTGSRLMFYNSRAITQMVYAHSGNDPADGLASITLDQCVGHFASGGGSGLQGGATNYVATNGCFTGLIVSAVTPNGANISMSRIITESQADSSAPFGGQDTGATISISQCAAVRHTVSGGSRGFVTPLTGQTITATNCSYDSPSNFYGQALGLFSNTAYTIGYNRMVVEANNEISKHASSTMTATDNNVYSRPGGGIGPFATWQGTAYNLTSAMAGWRTASGKDAASIALTTSPFTGTTTDGDFTVSSAAQIGGVYSGVTEHWDFNVRAVVSTPPTRWAVGPRTYAEALAYIASPTTWEFYP